jgi:serine/threonine protein kinase/Tol biopolymer transport system component
MTPERWKQIDQLLDSALQREASQRPAFLEQACAGDEELRREVESLLAHKDKEQAQSFIEVPALEAAAKGLAVGHHESLVGRRLGPYKIHSLLGVGGMGEVYLAHDPRLDRDIALKILPTELASDPDRIRRFIREARAASGLKHPNVATIYEIGEFEKFHFIAMEYVEGQTLASKISGRPLLIGEIVDIGIQVADALDEAHQKGITHRDIKPANLMLTLRGQVKTLDFGLAKVARPEGQALGSDISTVVKTDTGVVMGTVQYMSPEQVLGREVDHRTDIFSLGVVLYEMATGRLPFTGTSSSETMDRLLHGQPEAIARFNYDVPAELERIIRKCLEKDRERRYQSARELLIDLRNHKRDSDSNVVIAEKSQVPRGSRSQTEADVKIALQAVKEELDSGAHAAVTGPQRGTRRWLLWSTAALALLVVGGGAVWFSRWVTKVAEAPLTVVPLTSYPGEERQPSFAPDGNQVAFSWNGEKQDNFDIYIKDVESGAQRRLTTAPEADSFPSWSPDGRTIAFVRERPGWKGSVYLVSPLGPPERKVAEIGYRHWRTVRLPWTPDGKSLVISDLNSENESVELFLLSVETGDRRRLTFGQEKRFSDIGPSLSRDGRALVFVRELSFLCDIYLLTLSEDFQPIGKPTRLTFENRLIWSPVWTVDGRELIFSSSSGPSSSPSLFRIAASGSGKPQRLAGVGENASEPAIAQHTQRLAYTSKVFDMNIWRVEVPGPYEKTSPPMKLISSTRADMDGQFSPDGRKIAFTSTRTGNEEIWVCNSDGWSGAQQLTSLLGGGNCGDPRWSPDGERIAFSSNMDGKWANYVINANGGKPKRFTPSSPIDEGIPSWSRDGKWIYFTSEGQVWKALADGGKAQQVTRRGGHQAFESADGNWLYYTRPPKTEGDSSLWRVPKDGGEETQVLEPVDGRTFAVVKEGIYFVPSPVYAGRTAARTSIQFFNFATKKIRSIASIERPVGYYLSVSPDGRWILYSQIDQETSDLMLVENFK